MIHKKQQLMTLKNPNSNLPHVLRLEKVLLEKTRNPSDGLRKPQLLGLKKHSYY